MHPGQNNNVPLSMLFSMAVHIIIVLFLITHAASKGVPKPQIRKIVVISLDSLREMGNPSAPVSETIPPSPQPVPKMTSVPPPDAQVVPKPKPKPATPPKPAPAAAAAKAQAKAPAPPLKQSEIPAQNEKRGDQGESIGITVLNQVRTNWLKPAGSVQSFHCRLRIDYRAGGMISNVVVLDGCGNDPLDDSVERAIWKTQPLPLGPAQNGPGSMVLEFTP
jgi:outer membrane biosynthesis protein TonB